MKNLACVCVCVCVLLACLSPFGLNEVLDFVDVLPEVLNMERVE
jgi:hypothetical protein